MSYNVRLTRILLRKMKTNQIGPYVHSFEDINANRNDYTELIQISDGNNRIDKYKTSRAISSTRFYKRQIDQLTLEYIRNMNNKIVSKLWPKKKIQKKSNLILWITLVAMKQVSNPPPNLLLIFRQMTPSSIIYNCISINIMHCLNYIALWYFSKYHPRIKKGQINARVLTKKSKLYKGYANVKKKPNNSYARCI